MHDDIAREMKGSMVARIRADLIAKWHKAQIELWARSRSRISALCDLMVRTSPKMLASLPDVLAE